MAIPSNIILTPDNADVGSLPIPVNVTGVDIFERPKSTGSYDFTPFDAGWVDGALQGQGIIGDSFVGNGVSAKVVHQYDIAITDFFFWAGWYEVTALDSDIETLVQIFDSDMYNTGTQLEGIILHVSKYETDEIRVICSKTVGGVHKFKFNQTTSSPLTIGLHHICAWIDTTDPANMPHVAVDGVELAMTTIAPHDKSFSIASTSNYIQYGALQQSLDRVNAWFLKTNVCNSHWSTNPLVVNDIAKYANIPIVEIN